MAGDRDLESRIESLERAVEEAGKRGKHRVSRLAIVVLLFLAVAAVSVPQLWFIHLYGQLQRSHTKEHLFWLVCHAGSTEQERTRAFLELLWLGNTEWQSARLSNLDLTGAHLEGADLHWANLEASKLQRAKLMRAVFTRSRLGKVDLSDADLSEANLVEANLVEADLRRANLNRANLTGAMLDQCRAAGAQFLLADLTGAALSMADLSGANLKAANLTEANLQLANLNSANLLLANLTGADLRKASLKDANWWQARGLAPDTLARLQAEFAPSENADTDLKKDYQTWLARRGLPPPVESPIK